MSWVEVKYEPLSAFWKARFVGWRRNQFAMRQWVNLDLNAALLVIFDGLEHSDEPDPVHAMSGTFQLWYCPPGRGEAFEIVEFAAQNQYDRNHSDGWDEILQRAHIAAGRFIGLQPS